MIEIITQTIVNQDGSTQAPTGAITTFKKLIAAYDCFQHQVPCFVDNKKLLWKVMGHAI